MPVDWARMIAIEELEEPEKVARLKREYLGSLSSPLDGMWEAFVDGARHWQLRSDERRVGYFCINEERQLLQFHLDAEHVNSATEVFSRVLAQQEISTAIVSTSEPGYLSLCLDAHRRVRVHSVLYRDLRQASAPREEPDGASLDTVAIDELPAIEAMYRASLDADPGAWLTGYLRELAERSELFALRRETELLGTGECRVSRSQPPYADLGMVVSRAHRRQGMASLILRRLKAHCYARQLDPICSTTLENAAARRAIENAGFVGRHRILEVAFQDTPE